MADQYSSLDDLLEQTGKTRLTPYEYRRLKQAERNSTPYEMLAGAGEGIYGAAADFIRGDLMGDERYDRDWTLGDAADPAIAALSMFGMRPAAAALKSKFAAGAAKGAGKGLQKGYNVATGAKRGAATAPKVGGPKGSMPKSSGKKTLDAPDGKAPDVKPGMMQKAGTAIKNNPITSTIAGAAGLGGAAAGVNAMLPDAPEGLDPLKKRLGDFGGGATVDDIIPKEDRQNLDNPNGQMAMTPEGQAQAAMQAKANSMPGMVNRQGGSGSKMPSLAQGRVQAQANFMADDIIKAQKIQARKDASKAHREGVMADNWETSQIGRESGKAWDELDDDTRQDMQKRFMANMGSPYDSSEGAKQARVDKVMNEFGGNYVSPDGETGAPGQLTKEQFMDKTGMRTEGTGITQNADGSFNTLEFGDTFENSGGRDSAEDYLIGQDQQGPVQPESGRIPDGQGGYSQPDPLLDPNVSAQQNQQRPFNPVEGGASMMANLDNFGPGSGSSTPNNSGKGMYTDEFGQQSELGKGTVRMSANDQEYGDANFKNKEDALGYLNRGASLEEPAPEAPAAPEAPEEEEGEEGGWDKYAPYLAPLALAHPATRKWGSKMLPKFKKNVKQLEGNFYNATPIPRFSGQAPRLGNSPMQLPNKAPGLPHRAPGLPNRADPNVPAALPNKSMSAPAGRQVTPEQFRKGQAGMGRSERNAYEDSQRPEFFRKAQYFLDDL